MAGVRLTRQSSGWTVLIIHGGEFIESQAMWWPQISLEGTPSSSVLAKDAKLNLDLRPRSGMPTTYSVLPAPTGGRNQSSLPVREGTVKVYDD